MYHIFLGKSSEKSKFYLLRKNGDYWIKNSNQLFFIGKLFLSVYLQEILINLALFTLGDLNDHHILYKPIIPSYQIFLNLISKKYQTFTYRILLLFHRLVILLHGFPPPFCHDRDSRILRST